MDDTKANDRAFPSTFHNGWGEPEKGMTLRDYFAAKAMQMAMQQYKLETGIFGEPIPEWKADACLSHVAADAYRMADAMLLERGA